jgi:hypothetical protein
MSLPAPSAKSGTFSNIAAQGLKMAAMPTSDLKTLDLSSKLDVFLPRGLKG